MKVMMNTIAKVAKITAEKALKRDANCTTSLCFYQPQIPTKMKRYKDSKR